MQPIFTVSHRSIGLRHLVEQGNSSEGRGRF